MSLTHKALVSVSQMLCEITPIFKDDYTDVQSDREFIRVIGFQQSV